MGEITSNENSLNVQGIARGKPCINHSGFFSVRSRAAFARNVPGWLRCLYVLINKKSLRERLFRSKPHTSLLLRQYCLLFPTPKHFIENMRVIKGILFESFIYPHCVTLTQLKYLSWCQNLYQNILLRCAITRVLVMTTGKYNIVFSISDQALIFLLLLFLYLYLRIMCNLKQTEWISEN